MKIGINLKLVVLCMLLVAIPAIILGIVGHNAAEKAINGGIDSRLKDQANQIALDSKTVFNIAQMKVKSDLGLAHEIFYSYGKAAIDSDGNMVLTDEKKDELAQKKVNSDLIVAHQILYSKGKIEIDPKETITMDATDQITKETKKATINVMKVGGKSIPLNYDIVDEIKSTTGVETATLFQVIPEGIIRISTNVMKLDGTRAVGTYIPKSSPVYQAIMNKQTYRGSAFVVNAWYKTAYEPILDDAGNVIGVLYVGAKESKQVLNGNYDIVDHIKSLSGATSTIFQLKKFEGEKENDVTSKGWAYDMAMYRISTNVMKLDGTRAVGTIVAKNVYDTIMKGESYYGRAFVVTGMYLTAYEPIRDAKTGEIIGILYVGIKEEDFQKEILSNLGKQIIGQTGYVFIYDSKGNYILSRDRTRDGENVWEETNSEGRKVVQEMVNKAMVLQPGQSDVIYYTWQNVGESNPRNKLAGLAYMKDWDWVIGASAYSDEDFGGAGGLKQVANTLLIVAIIAILSGAIVAYLFANMISRPIKKMTEAGNKIADGDLNAEIPQAKTGDEVEELGVTMSTLVAAIKYLKGEKSEAKKKK